MYTGSRAFESDKRRQAGASALRRLAVMSLRGKDNHVHWSMRRNAYDEATPMFFILRI